MKKFKQSLAALIIISSLSLYSCGPNDDEGTMDSKTNREEQQIDSSKMISRDSAVNTEHKTDSD
jgi:hypothetical protein